MYETFEEAYKAGELAIIKKLGLFFEWHDALDYKEALYIKETFFIDRSGDMFNYFMEHIYNKVTYFTENYKFELIEENFEGACVFFAVNREINNPLQEISCIFSLEEDGLETYNEVLNVYAGDVHNYIVYYFKTLKEAKLVHNKILNK